MFKDIRKRSKEYENLSTRFETDLELAREFAKIRGQREGIAFGKSYGLSWDEVIMLGEIAKKYVYRASTNNYTLKVSTRETSEVLNVSECGASKYYRDLMEGGEDSFGREDLMALYAEAIMAPVDYRKKVSTVIAASQVIPPQMRHNVAPIINTCEKLDENKITSQAEAVKLLANELIGHDSNVPLMLNYIESAPSACMISLPNGYLDKVEREKSLIVAKKPVFKVPDENKVQEVASVTLYDSMNVGGFSSKCNGNAFFMRHIYGIRFRSDMMKYVSFLTDLRVSENITVVHLHHKDTKYAIGLMNMYPNIKVVIKGSGTIESTGALSVMTKSDMIKNCKTETVLGVFIKVRKYSKPNKKEDLCGYAREQDKPIRISVMQYKHYFRYIDPHVMVDEQVYRQTINTGSGTCIESNIGECLSRKQMWYRMAVAMIHRQTLPWHLTPLFRMQPNWYPKLKEIYSLAVTDRIVEAINVSGFITFAHDNEDPDFLKFLKDSCGYENGIMKSGVPKVLNLSDVTNNNNSASRYRDSNNNSNNSNNNNRNNNNNSSSRSNNNSNSNKSRDNNNDYSDNNNNRHRGDYSHEDERKRRYKDDNNDNRNNASRNVSSMSNRVVRDNDYAGHESSVSNNNTSRNNNNANNNRRNNNNSNNSNNNNSNKTHGSRWQDDNDDNDHGDDYDGVSEDDDNSSEDREDNDNSNNEQKGSSSENRQIEKKDSLVSQFFDV